MVVKVLYGLLAVMVVGVAAAMVRPKKMLEVGHAPNIDIFEDRDRITVRTSGPLPGQSWTAVKMKDPKVGS